MKDSPVLEAEREYVANKLAGKIICDRCKCTLDRYAVDCTADLADPCPGFMSIEAAKREFQLNRQPLEFY